MVESNSQKKLWPALGAVGGLVAAALAFHYMSGDSEEGSAPAEISQDELLTQLKEKGLDPVKRADGMIEGNYFIMLLQFIGETNKDRLAESRATSVAQRREHFKKEDWDSYAQCVRTAFEEEDKSAQEIMAEVSAALGITQGEFQGTHQQMASDPQKAEMVMAAQQGKYAPPDLKKKPTLSKKKTMEVMEETQKQSAAMMQVLKKLENEPGLDQMEKMLAFMVEQIKMQDKIWSETGVENDEFEESLMIYMRTDPEVQRTMQAYMMKMQMQAAQQMGGNK